MKNSKDKKKFNVLIDKIDTKEKALVIVKETSWLYILFLPILIIIFSFWLGNTFALLDVVIYVFLGLFLYQTKSRIVAGLMLIFALWVLVVTVLAKAGVMEGGTNIILAALVVLVSFRAIKATTYLRANK